MKTKESDLLGHPLSIYKDNHFLFIGLPNLSTLYPNATTIIEIIGDIILNMQYGRYTRVGTPSTLACATPHVFQGMSTDVTVAES